MHRDLSEAGFLFFFKVLCVIEPVSTWLELIAKHTLSYGTLLMECLQNTNIYHVWSLQNEKIFTLH